MLCSRDLCARLLLKLEIVEVRVWLCVLVNVWCALSAREAPKFLQGPDDTSNDNGFRVVKFERVSSARLAVEDTAKSSSCCGGGSGKPEASLAVKR